MIIIEDRMELALHIIELKKAQMIKENNEKSFNSYKKKIEKIMKEKEKVYQNDKETIDMVLNTYLQDVSE